MQSKYVRSVSRIRGTEGKYPIPRYWRSEVMRVNTITQQIMHAADIVMGATLIFRLWSREYHATISTPNWGNVLAHIQRITITIQIACELRLIMIEIFLTKTNIQTLAIYGIQRTPLHSTCILVWGKLRREPSVGLGYSHPILHGSFRCRSLRRRYAVRGSNRAGPNTPRRFTDFAEAIC